jgi:hypothetical protein
MGWVIAYNKDLTKDHKNKCIPNDNGWPDLILIGIFMSIKTGFS